ncbi:hypothetical protein N2152v2_004747 [Parachlorella kessleri]
MRANSLPSDARFVVKAHGYLQELFTLTSGGQSSLAWLATVYAGIIYSLLVVAASIYAHRRMYGTGALTEHQQQASRLTKQQLGQQQLQQQQTQLLLPVPGLPRPPSWPLAGEPCSEQGPTQQQPALLNGFGWPGRESPEGGAVSLPLPRQPSPSALQRKASTLPVGDNPGPSAAAVPEAAGGPAAAAAAVPVQDLAQALRSDKRQAAGLWERALGLARVPGGMQSVLGLLSNGEPAGELVRPPESRSPVVVDVGKLRAPLHRRLPSMSKATAQHQAKPPLQQQQQSRPGSSAREGSGKLSTLDEEEGLGAAGSQPQGQQQQRAARLNSDDSVLSDMEKDVRPAPRPSEAAGISGNGSGGPSSKPSFSKVATALRAAAPMLLRWRRKRQRQAAQGGNSVTGEGPGSGGGGSTGGGTPRLDGSGRELADASYRAHRTLKWMLLTLIAANSATLVWLLILLVATGAWLVGCQAVSESASKTLELASTSSMGTYSAALGLTQQNQAAVSTFAQLFGEAFLALVKRATGDKYSFTSYEQLREVTGEDASLLAAAGVAALNMSVNDAGVQAMVAPQFHPLSAERNATNLPCPSMCLNFRYFNFLESTACACNPATIQEVDNLASTTVDRLAVALAGLGLMIVSVLVLLLRFATHRGQVETRWALRPALLLYASHKEETALKRKWQRGTTVPTPTYSW